MLVQRFIPTCVGYMTISADQQYEMTVHPHVRGVYDASFWLIACQIGSSPRAWGISPRATPGRPCIRFIPTCVGYMMRWFQRCKHRPVHPHVRGVYVVIAHVVVALFRFIPTCVGYMQTLISGCYAPNGSSPRAWGIFVQAIPNMISMRFIPTCVGYILEKHLKRFDFHQVNAV